MVLAGQAGVQGHIVIGDGAVAGGQAGVTKSVPAGQTVSGYPAREHRAAMRVYAHMARLPEMAKRLKALEQEIARLKGEDPVDPTAAND